MNYFFKNREQAGEMLAERLTEYQGQDCVVLAVPRGGAAVAYPIARRLQAPLDLIIPRKLPIPWEPEAGFGAVTPDGTIVLNEPLAKSLGLTSEKIWRVARTTLAEVRRREERYRAGHPRPEMENKTVILVDDGLASGFTMVAAIKSVQKAAPRAVVVAVPVSPLSSARMVSGLVDRLVCLITEDASRFAVASFYSVFHDLSDEEVVDYLKRANDLTLRDLAERHPKLP